MCLTRLNAPKLVQRGGLDVVCREVRAMHVHHRLWKAIFRGVGFRGTSRVKAHRNVSYLRKALLTRAFRGTSRVKAHRNFLASAFAAKVAGSEEPRASKRIETSNTSLLFGDLKHEVPRNLARQSA